MKDPLIACVMPTRYARLPFRTAHESLLRQTWRNKLFVILAPAIEGQHEWTEVGSFAVRRIQGAHPIGELRNLANAIAVEHGADYIAHFDDDDWSAPTRLEEQMELLRSTDAQAVGYSSMYFWRSPTEAWLYKCEGDNVNTYALGTSLLYPIGSWAGRPFLEVPEGEDGKWLDGSGWSGFERIHEPLKVSSVESHGEQPRMIARIHEQSISFRSGARRAILNPLARQEGPLTRVEDAATLAMLTATMG